MTTLVLNRPPKSSTSSAQKTFDRLIKKIKNLQMELQRRGTDLAKALEYFYRELAPEELRSTSLLTDCVKLMYPYYKKPKYLSQNDRRELKDLIRGAIHNMCQTLCINDMDPELLIIYKAITGTDLKTIALDEFTELKDLTEAMCSDEGFDIDLSTIDPCGDFSEAQDQFFEAILKAAIKMEDLDQEAELEQPKKKSKRELAKEAKAKQLEALQQKGISTIYKQLAKVLHPDREQDPLEKTKKEAVMKKLTTAYENNDLVTLLALEMDWMNVARNDEEDSSRKSDAQLKIYNSVLQDQVAELEDSIQNAHRDGRYMPILKYCQDTRKSPLLCMMQERQELQEKCQAFQETLTGLQGPDPLATIRSMVKA